MNTDDEYYCSKCGSFLNKQTRFSENNSKWVCTECAFCNKISRIEEAIIRDVTFKNKVFDKWKGVNPMLKKIVKGIVVVLSFATAAVIISKVSENKNTDEEDGEDGFGMRSNIDYSGETCRWCGSPLIADEDGEDFRGILRYECSNSNCHGVFFSENGESPLSPEERCKSNNNTCVNCGMSLSGGAYTAPWENGNNSDGYIQCPHCGSVNFQWEDD